MSVSSSSNHGPTGPDDATPDTATLRSYRDAYETELFERVLPFWLENSPDRQHGGYYNCLDRTGDVYDTTKHSWLQGRQVWMLSRLYREAGASEAVRERWLEVARLGVDFLREHALRPNGQVFFSLTEDGQPIYQQRKIFSECFYVMALAEYARAASRPDLLAEAEEQLDTIWEWAYDWSQVGRPSHEGQPDAQQLAVPMILLNLLEVVADGESPGDDRSADRVADCIRRIRRHVDTDAKRVYETVAPDGSRLPGSDGRLLNPGHAIEAGWFLHHWADRLGREDLRRLAVNVVRWSFETGWDDEHGGIFYFLDAGDTAPTKLEWFMKLWWPHTEALYAHLLNYAATGDAGDWRAFETVHAYTFDHFPDREHGGWFGYLDREGRVTHAFKGAPYKGFFHVPRALWLCIRLLRAME